MSCDATIGCPCDNLPYTGYDSALPQPQKFLATGYAAAVPPLGFSAWLRTNCLMFADSTASQSAAQFIANQQALLCALGAVSPYGPDTSPNEGGGGGGITPPSPFVFFSAAAECTVNCPDGLPFTFSVPAGAFVGTTQAAADTAANTFACQQAAMRAVCLSDLSPTTFTLNQPYSGTITATGGELAGPGQTNLWQLTAGSLPPGLTFNGGALASNQVTITGTPTGTGTYTFTVSCTDPGGDTMTKTYSITCASATATTLNDWFDGFSGTHLTGFQSGTPDVGYDTAWNSIRSVQGTVHGGVDSGQVEQLNLNFTSGGSKTWHLKIVVLQLNSGGWVAAYSNYSVTINGVVQGGWVVTPSGADNLATWIGTFNTANCANTPVAISARGDCQPFLGCGAISAVQVEWSTPS